MKKRLLSLVLCLVMVFSLFPSFAMASTIENVGTDGDYVYTPVENQTWTTDLDYASYGDLYFYDGNSYYQVNTVPHALYDAAGTSWKLTNAVGKYFKISDTSFGEVQTGNGYLYSQVSSTLGFRDFFADGGDHVESGKDTYGIRSNYFVKFTKDGSDCFGRVYAQVNAKSLLAHFQGRLFYYNANDGQDPDPSGGEIGRVNEGRAAPTEWTTIISKFTQLKNIKNNNQDYTTFIWGGSPDITGNTFYTRDNGTNPNHLEYDSSGNGSGPYAQIPGSSLKNELNTDPVLYTGTLYSTAGTGVESLYYTQNGNSVDISTAANNGKHSYLKGDTIYSGVLYTREKLGTLGGHKDIAGNPADGYTLTIDSWATGKYQNFVDGGEPTPVDPPAKTPLDIVLVVDQSGSMRTQDLEGGAIQYNSTNQTEWTVAELKNGTQYYYFDGQNYYPVQLGRGTVYRYYGDVRGDWTFGWGNDGISVMVNGAPTYYNVRTFYYVYVDADGDGVKEMHRLRAITAGLDLHYGFYPYIYKDENNEYAQMSKWKDNHYWFRLISPWGANKLRLNDRWNTIVAGGNNDEAALISFLDTDENLLGATDAACNSAKMNYSWVTSTAKMKDLYVANGRDYADLYYVDANGERHNISTRYFSTDNFNTKEPLYTISGGSSRVSALESAVGQFVDALKLDEADDRLAIVGYAQNSEETTVPSGVKYVGRQSGSYVNTGVFSGTDFKGFTNYDANPSYALQSVADVNFSADTFGTWGGTYTNYGMAMANKIDGRENAQKVVIFFTDGEPGELGYEHTVAAETLINGADVKDNAKVYTVGLYPQSASDEVKTFLKQLSSEYKTKVDSVPVSDMDPGQTYFVKQGDSYTAISTDYYGESSLGWWEHNADGTYTLMNVKGANAGAGEEYLYTGIDGQGETTGENADTSKTYYSSRNNEVKYEYHWFDAQMNDIVPSGSVYTLSNTRQEGAYSMTASTKAGLEQIFTELAATIRPTEDASQQAVAPSANGTATNYDKTNSYVQDVISSDFDLGSPYTVTVTELENVTFANGTADTSNATVGAELVSGTGISAERGDYSYVIDGDTIKVYGWDFGAGYAANKALRVTITGLTPTVTGTAYSNVSAKSGIYEKTTNERLCPFDNNPSIDIPTYTVQWSVKGSIVETDSDVPYNSMPSYDGEAPANYQEGNMAYTFVGWSSTENDEAHATTVDKLPKVTKSVTYYAVYHAEQIKDYTVKWNVEGSVVETDTQLHNGDYPSYDGAMPTKPAADGTNYVFVGWTTDGSYVYNEDTFEKKIYVGNETVDQLADANDVVNFYAVFAPTNLDVNEKNLVLGFNKTVTIDTGVNSYEPVAELGGKFALSDDGSGTFSFALNSAKTGDRTYDFTPMSSVNRAYYDKVDATTGDYTEYNFVTVVASSSIYFDDDLESAAAVNASDLKDYQVTTAESNSSTKTETNETATITYTFTFTGTGVDILTTTHDKGGYVKHGLYYGTETTTANLVPNTKAAIRNYSTTDRYNVPTISYKDLEYGTYTVKLEVLKGARFNLDGVRVYNTVGSADSTGKMVQDESPYVGDAASEVNASFTELRTMLIESKITGTSKELGTGYFYTDNTDKSIKYVVNEAGEKESVEVPSYTQEAYTIDGPKHEIYLPKGSGIAFTIDNWGGENGIKASGAQIMVALSAPQGGEVTVSLSDGTVNNEDAFRTEKVKNAVDYYFTVVPSDDGNVMITNDSDSEVMLSVSKLKVSGCKDQKIVPTIKATTLSVEEQNIEEVPMYLSITQDTLRYAKAFRTLSTVEEIKAESDVNDDMTTEDPAPTPTPAPTPVPTQTPSIRNILHQIVSDFVSRLFGSMSRLFGK